MAAPWPNQLGATRVAVGPRASIPSSANCPSPRRTNRVAVRLPTGTTNAMTCDCILDPCGDTELTLESEASLVRGFEYKVIQRVTPRAPPPEPDKNCHW